MSGFRFTYAALAACLGVGGCATAGSIRASEAWIEFEMIQPAADTLECIADRFEAAGMSVSVRRRSAVVSQQLGILFPETYVLYVFDVAGNRIVARKRDDFIFPNAAKSYVTGLLAPCLTP